MSGAARLNRWLQHAERLDIGMELRRRPRRDLGNRVIQRQIRVFFRGPRVNLVIDVGDVAGIRDVFRAVSDAAAAGTARRTR